MGDLSEREEREHTRSHRVKAQFKEVIMALDPKDGEKVEVRRQGERECRQASRAGLEGGWKPVCV